MKISENDKHSSLLKTWQIIIVKYFRVQALGVTSVKFGSKVCSYVKRTDCSLIGAPPMEILGPNIWCHLCRPQRFVYYGIRKKISENDKHSSLLKTWQINIVICFITQASGVASVKFGSKICSYTKGTNCSLIATSPMAFFLPNIVCHLCGPQRFVYYGIRKKFSENDKHSSLLKTWPINIVMCFITHAWGVTSVKFGSKICSNVKRTDCSLIAAPPMEIIGQTFVAIWSDHKCSCRIA